MSRAKLSRTVAIPDVHAPYHSERAWKVFLKAADALKPDNIVIIGDFADCYSISRYTKSPERKQGLRSEFDNVNARLKEIERLGARSNTSRIIYLEGNHENRLERYLCERAPELYGLITTPDLLKVRDRVSCTGGRKWQWVPYQEWVSIGDMSYAHDVGHAGINATRQSLVEFGGNLCFGHSHRAGVAYESTLKGEQRCALNIGWLGDPFQIDYRHRASAIRNSQHGFGFIEQDDNGRFSAQFVPIVNQRLCIVAGHRIAN